MLFPMSSGIGGPAELDRATSLRLLGLVPYGRLVFTKNAMPAIRPVSHVIDDEEIVLPIGLPKHAVVDTPGLRIGDGTVVAYQADALDITQRIGWSVVVTGLAFPLDDRQRIAKCQPQLHDWIATPTTEWIVLEPHLVTGVRFNGKVDAGGS
jgi:hypothetical protein